MLINNFKLGSLLDIKTGKLDANASSENGIYPFFTCSKEPLKISSYSYDCECVLVAGNGDLNVKYYNGKFDAYQRTYILKNVREDILNTRYLYYFMEKYVEKLREESIGGVIKYIKLGNLTDAIIPVFSISIQDNIVQILDLAQILINKRKMQIKACEELIKSRFVEMFGDPKTNPKKWKEGTVRDIVTEVKYGTSKPAIEGGKYKYIRMNNITYNGELDLTDLKYIDISENEVEKCIVRKGDVLFNRTNSKELVGKTCVFNQEEDMVIAGYIIRVRVNEKALPEYLSAILNSKYGKETLFGMCKAIVGQANINAQELQEIKIIMPPIELQKNFVEFKEQVDKLKFDLERSLSELEDNFDALMQKAFKGEL